MEQFLIALIVLLAAWYAVRSVLRAWRGKTACAEDMCLGCAFKDGCTHAAPSAAQTGAKTEDEELDDAER